MSQKINLLNDLKERGLRVTPQRAIILEAIEQLPGHITAEDIFAIVQQTSPYISLATVYRTLDLLKELGLITESNMGTGTTHYALMSHGPHHHAVCRKCNRSIELPHNAFTPLVEQLRTEYNFIADANHIVMLGWCQECQPED
jgi:Fur family ferric uptake transcriptional regulator